MDEDLSTEMYFKFMEMWQKYEHTPKGRQEAQYRLTLLTLIALTNIEMQLRPRQHEEKKAEYLSYIT